MYSKTFERVLSFFSKIENRPNSLTFLIGCAIIVSLVKNLLRTFDFVRFARLRM